MRIARGRDTANRPAAQELGELCLKLLDKQVKDVNSELRPHYSRRHSIDIRHSATSLVLGSQKEAMRDGRSSLFLDCYTALYDGCMPYAHNFIKIRWNLAFAKNGQEEQLSFSLSAARQTGNSTQQDLNNLDAAVLASVGSTILQSIRSSGSVNLVSNGYSGQSVHAMLVGTNGLKVAGSVSREVPFPWNGTSSASIPLQLAVCVTLQSQEMFGPGRFGRFYLPAPTDINSFMYTTGLQNNVSAGVANALNALNASFQDGHLVVIASRGGVDSGAPGFRPVSIVSVDSKPDTVRRRTNQLKGSRVTTPLGG